MFARLLPYLLALPIFYLAAFSIFYPELSGKFLQQTDIIQFEGVKRASIAYAEKNGETALWNISMFSGVPEYLIAGVPTGGLEVLERITAGFINPKWSSHVLFRCFFCCWVMLLCFRVNPYLAIAGAVSFGLSTYNIVTIEAGHFTKMWAIAYACLVLGGMKLVFDKKYLLGFLLFALGLTLELGANHYQITFYLAIACLVYVIAEIAYGLKDIPHLSKAAGVFVLGVSLALLTQTARLWMTLEYTPYSIRGEREMRDETAEDPSASGLDKQYAFSWSQGKMETFTLLVPYLYGGSSHEKPQKGSAFIEAYGDLAGEEAAKKMLRQDAHILPMYRGDQPFTSGPVYAGALVCLFFVLSFFVLERRQLVWLAGGAAMAMFIAWGSNFEALNYLLFDWVPGFNKFRSPSMALSITIILMVLAGALALNKLFEEGWKEQRKMLIAAGIVGGLAVLIGLSTSMMDMQTAQDASMIQRIFGTDEKRIIDTFTSALEEDRISWARADAFRAAFLVALAAGVLFFFMKGKLSKGLAIALLGVVAFADVWLVDKRYIGESKFQSERKAPKHQASQADEFILKDKDPHYRVLDFQNTYNQATTSYFHKTIGGYFAAKLGRYQDLIENRLMPEQQQFIDSLRQGKPAFSQLHTLNMLNAKYFKFGDTPREVIQNPFALGNAWFVSEVQTANSPKEEMEKLGKLNTRYQAVYDQSKFKLDKQAFAVDSLASIKLSYYDNRRAEYISENSQEGLAVFSEVYYPNGWQVTIDGQPAELVRVNYVLRAVRVPAGKHEIKFLFAPESYIVGAPVSKYSSMLLLVCFIAGFGFAGYREVAAKKA